MNDRTLPFHEHEVGLGSAIEHQLFRRAGDEIGDHGVDADSPPFDEDAGLPGGGEAGPDALFPQRAEKLELRGHLPDVAVGADGEHHGRVHVSNAAVGDGDLRWRPTQVVDGDVVLACNLDELGNVTEEAVQATPHLEPVLDGAAHELHPFGRNLAARRRDADEEGVGTEREPLIQCGDDGNVATEAEDLL